MDAQELINRFCDLEINIIELYRDISKFMRKSGCEHLGLKCIHSACFDMIQTIKAKC